MSFLAFIPSMEPQSTSATGRPPEEEVGSKDRGER
ncbi:hypothetical protein LINPERHAP1_LOCUS35142 [Linum perenne]